MYRASDISRKKKAKFRGIFRGKFAEKSADFAGFSREKSQISKDFQGKFLEKSADFTGNFGGKLRQETISKKQPISMDFFWRISRYFVFFWEFRGISRKHLSFAGPRPREISEALHV